MSRKAFLIWGLVIVSFTPMATAAIQYLGISKIIDVKAMNQASDYLAVTYLIGIPIAFGTVLHLRFKDIGRRKRILALCLSLYIISLPLTWYLSSLYAAQSGATERFMGAIGEWANMSDPKSETPWTHKHAINYALASLPSNYLAQLGLFALLWFGSLDPRKPSKNRFVQFMKTGFERKDTPKAAEITKLAMV